MCIRDRQGEEHAGHEGAQTLRNEGNDEENHGGDKGLCKKSEDRFQHRCGLLNRLSVGNSETVGFSEERGDVFEVLSADVGHPCIGGGVAGDQDQKGTFVIRTLQAGVAELHRTRVVWVRLTSPQW